MQMSLFGCATITLLLAAILMPQDVHSASRESLAAPRCNAGSVWREAYAGDTVCVAPRRRDAVRAENALAAKRVQPGGGAYGPDTCASRYVWRGARDSDHVCVSPGSRDIVARENAGEISALRQRLAQRRQELAKVKEEARKAEQRLRDEDAKWMRENPGLGRSSQPSIADNVSPIEQEIRQIEAALQAAEREAARVPAAGSAPAQPQPTTRGK